MQITITFSDGHTETFTGCTAYSHDGGYVKFHGTDPGGETADYEFSDRIVDRIKKVGA